MLNSIWPFSIIISFFYAIISGNLDNLNKSILESAQDAVNLCISLLGSMCLWNGIMQIANKSSAIEKLTNFLKPFINKLFPEMKENNQIKKEISMNIIANVLGLGNAATPLGIKAMKSMQRENKDKNTLSNSMLIFIVLNTASLQLIPTTIIAIRNSLGSENSTKIVFPVWIVTALAAFAAVFTAKLLIKREEKNKKWKQ